MLSSGFSLFSTNFTISPPPVSLDSSVVFSLDSSVWGRINSIFLFLLYVYFIFVFYYFLFN
eukprot:UN33150